MFNSQQHEKYIIHLKNNLYLPTYGLYSPYISVALANTQKQMKYLPSKSSMEKAGELSAEQCGTLHEMDAKCVTATSALIFSSRSCKK